MAQHGPRARAIAIALRRRREPDPVPWWVWALLALSLLMAGTVHAQTGGESTLPPAASSATIPPGAGGSGTAPAPRPRSEDPISRTAEGARPTPDAGILATPSDMGEAKAPRTEAGSPRN